MVDRRRIPVAAPVFAGNERAYVLECLDSTWISSAGPFVARFEQAFADRTGVRRAEACANGTVALHLVLRALGVGPGDEVVVPALTFVASANAVTYCGARPVFCDIDPVTWNIDPGDLERRLGPRTKAVIAVHLYGHPAPMDELRAVLAGRDVALVEDAAEAHGARYRGSAAGALGDAAAFSFYGNKIITTGEGGMVTTDDEALADRVRLLKGQGMDPSRRYWFIEVGYNYRLTNVAAAIGLAQLERLDWHLGRRRAIADGYRQRLKDLPSLAWQYPLAGAEPSWWMFTIRLVGGGAGRRDRVMAMLAEDGIETRPAFPALHRLPPYRELAPEGGLPVAETVADEGISLPTWAGLSDDDLDVVVASVARAVAADV